MARIGLLGASITFGVKDGVGGFHYGEIIRQWLALLGWEVIVKATPAIRWEEWLPSAPERPNSHVVGEIQPEDTPGGMFGIPPENLTTLHPFSDYFLYSLPFDVVWLMGGLNSALKGIGGPGGLQPVPAIEWLSHLESMASAVHAAGVPDVIAAFDTPMVLTEGYPAPGLVAAVNATMAEYELLWLDWTPPPGVTKGPNLQTIPHTGYGNDPLHPKFTGETEVSGHLWIAQQVMAALGPIALARGLPWW